MAIPIPPYAIMSLTGATWLDDSGIIISVGKNHAIHTLEHAVENHAINKTLASGKRLPFLIDMTDVKSISRDAGSFYAGEEPAKILTAVAILTSSHIGKMVGNTFMELSKPILPTKLFTNYHAALSWLLQYKV